MPLHLHMLAYMWYLGYSSVSRAIKRRLIKVYDLLKMGEGVRFYVQVVMGVRPVDRRWGFVPPTLHIVVGHSVVIEAEWQFFGAVGYSRDVANNNYNCRPDISREAKHPK